MATSSTRITPDSITHKAKREARAMQAKPRIDRLRARRRSREWEVRITHEFIQTWAHILHPQSFLVFTVLEMFADWRPGPMHGHTRGLQTLADLCALTALDKNSLRRALMELEFYSLISFPQGQKWDRRKTGSRINIVVIQDANPPKVNYRQDFKELKRLKSIVGAPTLGAQRGVVWVRSAERSSPLSAPQTTPHSAEGTTPLCAEGKDSIALDNAPPYFPVASSSVPPTPKTTTTATDQWTSSEAETLFKLLPEYFDLKACHDLIRKCRAIHGDCTTHEILQFVLFKLPLIDAGRVKNPVGFLLAAVPEAMRGYALTGYRASVEAQRAAAIARNTELESWKCSLDDFKPANGNGHNSSAV